MTTTRRISHDVEIAQIKRNAAGRWYQNYIRVDHIETKNNILYQYRLPNEETWLALYVYVHVVYCIPRT